MDTSLDSDGITGTFRARTVDRKGIPTKFRVENRSEVTNTLSIGRPRHYREVRDINLNFEETAVARRR